MYSHGLLSLSVLISEIRTMLSLILAVVCGVLMSASSSLGVKLYGDACAGQLNMKCKVTDRFADKEESYYPMCMKDCAAGACPENICDCECDARHHQTKALRDCLYWSPKPEVLSNRRLQTS